MSSSPSVSVGAAVPVKRKSRMPARLDFLQSASGLALGLFMWGHMFFVSSILLGKDAMWTITRFFEGYFFFGRAYPVDRLVRRRDHDRRCFVGHAMLAVRKFPINYAQCRAFRDHMRHMKHEDTTLWFWQVVTGFALFFLASIHLYVMLTRPERIGPFESADRVWSEHLLAALPRAAVRRRDPRRHRPVPPVHQVGLVRPAERGREPATPEDR